MNVLSITASLLARAFSYSLLYSLAQGLLVFGVLFVLLKAIPSLSARVRYLLAFGSMVVMLVWFADTMVAQYTALSAAPVYITDTQNCMPVAAPTIAHTTPPVGYASMLPVLPRLDTYVPFIAGLYLLGLLLMVVRFVHGMVRLRRLGHSDLQSAPPHFLAFVESWSRFLNIERSVRVAVSARVGVPMMMGVLRPVILLPVSAVSTLSTDELEAILLHELAHIRRHDYLLNIVQSAIESLMFFNPFIWLASRVVRREREHCCDDVVLAYSASPLPYARALARLGEFRGAGSLSIAATGNSHQLFNRIKRINEMKREQNPYGRVSAAIIALLVPALVVTIVAFTPSFAQKSKTSKSAPQKKVTTTTITIDSTGRQNVVKKTTIEPAGKHAEECDEDVVVSSGSGGRKSVTKVFVLDDGTKVKGGKKVKREIVVSGGNARWFDSESLDAEMDKAKTELESVDWDQVKETVAKALRSAKKELDEIDIDKITRQIDEEVKKEMQRSKQAMAQAKVEMEHAKRSLSRAVIVNGGNGHYHTTSVPLTRLSTGGANAGGPDIEIFTGPDDTEEMLSKMEQDGLINREKKFKIEKEDEVLYINGEKQPDRVYHKYNRYLHGKDVSISGNKGDLNISINN